MTSPAPVLQVVGSLEGGGAERWVRELAPRLAARGVNTEIVAVYPPRLDKPSLQELRCTVHHQPKRQGFDPVHFAWLCGLMRSRGPSIVHTHQWAGKYVGRAAAIVSGAPILVHTEHSPNALGWLERSMANVLSRRTDAVVAFTETNAEFISNRERVVRFEIIRNGLPLPVVPTPELRAAMRQRLGISDGTVAFGVVASLQARKNPALALRAFALLPAGGAPTRLDFFGDGILRDDLEREARELGISERVRFHGFVPDVRALLPALDAFLTVAKHEIAPVSILEGMAVNLPVIGTPHPGTLEMVEHDVTGLIVDWDVEELAHAMHQSRDDAEWRHRCGHAGRQRVERDYDIEDIADQHVAFYERLMRNRNGSLR